MVPVDADGNDGRGDRETYLVIGSAMEVHRQLGHGFLESVYQEALAVEFVEREIPFQREVELPVFYKGRVLACTFRADFVCFGNLIVELKAIGELTPREHSQVLNYLKATALPRALLFNFGSPRLEFKRFVSASYRCSSVPSVDQPPGLSVDHSPVLSVDPSPNFSVDQSPDLPVDESPDLSVDRSPKSSVEQQHSVGQPVHVEVSRG